LPRALLEALGKDYFFKKISLCLEPSRRLSAKTIFKKKIISLPRALLEALGKDYFQKKIISLPRALLEALDKDYFQKKNYLFAESRSGGSRQRIFSKKNKINLCRELGLAALGKVAVSPPTP